MGLWRSFAKISDFCLITRVLGSAEQKTNP